MNNILVIEDNADILEAIEVVLSLSKYSVQTLSGGEKVWEQISKIRPDLIILDVMMPKPDGYQLCKELKSNPITKQIPVMLLSAKSQKSDIEQGYLAGADVYMTKPFQNEDLRKAVSGLLEKHYVPQTR